ncbi:MAG: SMP-30/gluconolactonase/LRE family protein [Tateyamaria sp.]|uniref:SMP-30/gluconolactonase/LRE family protein n=1 Tax=Tateyamaria sp. TaxID=1929288 RepID=UPI00329AE5DF
MRPKCIAQTNDVCGEAATWDATRGLLYWCDINRFLLHILDPETGALKTIPFDEPVTAISLTDRDGWLLIALGSCLILFNPDTEAREDLANGMLLDWPELRFNDGRSDPSGAFWIGSMGNNVGPQGEALPAQDGKGTLYRYRAGTKLEAIETGIGIPNTVCWAPDGETFYFGDTLKNEISAYPRSPATGDIGAGKPFFAGFERGLPDGSAMDSEGYLWNCRYGGRCIVRIAPTGDVDRIIDLPVENVTTCTFGGPNLKTLFITTAGAEKAGIEPLAGGLFALDVDTSGLKENVFSIE